MNVTLGIPAGLIQSSPINNVTGGVEVVLPILVVLGVSVLVLRVAHRTLVVSFLATPWSSRANKATRHVLTAVSAAAALCIGVVVVGLIDQDHIGQPLGIFLPVALTVGAAAFAYRLHVPERATDNANRTATTLLICLSVIGVLWAGALYAQTLGTRYAQHFVDNADDQADTMILSRAPLHIIGPGVTVEPLPQDQQNGGYGYCYRGLRYLMGDDRYLVFAPLQRRPTIDSLFLIPTTTDMRFDTKRARPADRPLTCSEWI